MFLAKNEEFMARLARVSSPNIPSHIVQHGNNLYVLLTLGYSKTKIKAGESLKCRVTGTSITTVFLVINYAEILVISVGFFATSPVTSSFNS